MSTRAAAICGDREPSAAAISVAEQTPVTRWVIPERFAACVAAFPKRLAVADATRRLTYEELERESNDLARRLQDAGARPERCIGLFTERSTQFVVAALAVLKTGAAYVPLDRSTPVERVSWIVGDAGMVALVTDSEALQELATESCAMLAVDRLSESDAKPFVGPHIDAGSLAYIVYTSGSTGKPKGVEVTHANLCNLLDWHQSAFAITQADRASHVAGVGFDAAGWEIWPYLTAGASVWIADESTRRSAEMLQNWLVAQEITIAFVPTALAELLLCAEWPPEISLRTLLTGGDTLRHRPDPELPFVVVNNYGPTECTVVATSGVVSPGDDDCKPSIGRPIANAVAFVLDDEMKPVACGASGELCIAGALVARGYRKLPELTAKQFVTYTNEAGETARIYRTGDRARLLASGEIEFLGRMDDQVKIRGNRIELGEIVACLCEYPGITAGAASVSDGGAGPLLVAYVVPARGVHITETDVRKYVGAKLPDYMMPAFFVALRALPLTSSGKVDKAALPRPSVENSLPKAPAANGKMTGVEREIGELVASMIRRPAIGADENFFMIGGHSMFGVQLVARIRETFGVQLPLRHLFTAPTVRELSNEVARLMRVH